MLSSLLRGETGSCLSEGTGFVGVERCVCAFGRGVIATRGGEPKITSAVGKLGRKALVKSQDNGSKASKPRSIVVIKRVTSKV